MEPAFSFLLAQSVETQKYILRMEVWENKQMVKTMRKRILAMMMALTLSAGLLAGCQKPVDTLVDPASDAAQTTGTSATSGDSVTGHTASQNSTTQSEDLTTSSETDKPTTPSASANPTKPTTSGSSVPPGPTSPNNPEVKATVSLAYIFTDHTVLQRDKKVKIWGTCTGADTVEVSFQNQCKTGRVTGGAFSVYLDPMAANANGGTLTVTAGNATDSISDVLVGDVWLCSGQSNMEWTVGALNTEQRVQIDKWSGNAQIRLAKIPRFSARTECAEFDKKIVWTDSSYTNLLPNSAYAFVFGARLQRELNVPIGIINSSFGGTDLEQWISAATLNKLGIRYGSPGSKYNYMIAPMKGLSIKGILWYQGENNTGRLNSYTDMFNAYAAQYRAEFEDPDLPIITTMLDRYGAEEQKWAPFRLEQWAIAQGDPRIEIVCPIDLGDRTNIHPNDKCELGVRAAELTLNKVYGKTSLPGQSAAPSGMTRSGDTLHIRFHDAQSGLCLSNGAATVASLVVVDAAGANHPVAGTLDGDKLVVSLTGISSPVCVRYAYAMYPDPINFYTQNGLPVAPFELAIQ